MPLIGLPRSIWLATIAVPPAFVAAQRLWIEPDTTSQVVPAQVKTLWAFVLFALGGGVGVLIA